MSTTSADTPLDLCYALEGKIVTMDTDGSVLNKGVVYINGNIIEAVQPAGFLPPAGFENCLKIRSKGTIYPGLIELHNHLSYNILPLWKVPKKYTNRAQWRGISEYRKYVSGPLQILAKERKGYLAALVRYVECKCLLGGVTTSQGITLASNSGIIKYYRGIIRNVEHPDDPALPRAETRTDDVKDAEDFLEKLHTDSCRLLHLSEGIDAKAREHFINLQLPDGQWAITDALAGIHSTGLSEYDLDILKTNGGSIIWSPLSNMLLYGDTARIKAAKEKGILIALGSDWSPSGSKNLLGELKVAKVYSDKHKKIFSDFELVQLVTINAARVVKWQNALGSIEAGKYADLIVVHGTRGDPYRRLLRSSEADISLVVINGIPRIGTVPLMEPFGLETERWQVGIHPQGRILYLSQTPGTAYVGTLSLRISAERLREGLQTLPKPPNFREPPLAAPGKGRSAERYTLILDNEEEFGQSLRPLAPAFARPPPEPAKPLEEILVPIELDPLTVADDPITFFNQLKDQPNLPDYIKTRLPKFYPKLLI